MAPKKAPSPPKTPAYCHHKAKDLAYVLLDGRMVYLGKHGSPESIQRYHREIAEYVANGRRLQVPKAELTVVELAGAFADHVRQSYLDHEGLVSDHGLMLLAITKQLAGLYGDLTVPEFGPRQLKALRQKWIDGDPTRTPTDKEARPNSRSTVNKKAHIIISIFRFGVENESVDESVYGTLRAVEPLRRGRTVAKESDKVLPVPLDVIEKTLPFLPSPIQAVVRLQLFTGARPGELLGLRGTDINTSDSETWTAELKEHKTAHRGQTRTLRFGPRAQAVLRDFLGKKPIHEYLFSPKDTVVELNARRADARTTPLSCGNSTGTNRKAKPKRSPGERYDTNAYRCCIQRACRKAGIEPWCPHQIRHTASTIVRAEFGLDTARAMLGQKSIPVAEIYAEMDASKVIDAIKRFG